MSKLDVSRNPHKIVQFSTLERAYTRRLYETQTIQQPSTADRGMASLAYVKRGFLTLIVGALTMFYPLHASAVGNSASTDSHSPDASATSTESAEEPAVATPPQESKEATDSIPEPEPKNETSTPVTTPVSDSSKPQAATKKPSGPDAAKYTYNAKTGLWESDKFTWDPDTNQTKPKDAPQYTYNDATGLWETKAWHYNPATDRYESTTVTVKKLPKGAKIISDQTNTDDKTADANLDVDQDVTVDNDLNSHAQSGNATVADNTQAGNATTGDALALANILNILQSSVSFSGSQINTFSSDVYGDVYGDLFIDPGAITQLQSGTTAPGPDLQVDTHTTGHIDNTIDLTAQSGNATVTRNATAGNATTGNVHAIANVVNLLNSAITSGGSFMGLLNIHGNLNGDVLLPPGVLDALLASNATATAPGNLSADLTDQQTITNQIDAQATSGNATVKDNATAGNATTGNALTNLTVLNLASRQITADNSLLVFVNVLGKWVGVIMDAPAGSTSAALGGNVTQNSGPGDTDLTVNTDNHITNTIKVTARSGNATVQGNTTAGNATTGNATASANVANIMNSAINTAGWFGVLFINVFGSWNGSFGVDTAAGNISPASEARIDDTATTTAHVFSFVPRSDHESTGDATSSLAATSIDVPPPEDTGHVLADSATTAVPEEMWEEGPAEPKKQASLLMPLIGLAAGTSLLGAERVFSARQRRRLT